MNKTLDLTSLLDEQAKVIEQKREFVDSLKPRIEALLILKDELVADIDKSNLDKDEKEFFMKKIGDYLENKENEVKTFSIIRSRATFATHDDAQQIFGKNFLIQNSFEDLYGHKVGKLVKVGFTVKQLETAVTNKGKSLFLFPEAQVLNGKATNLVTLAEAMNGKVTKTGTTLLWKDQFKNGQINKDDWFANDFGIMNDTLHDSYVLRSIDFITDSTNKSVAYQKKLECLEAKSTFGDTMPEEWKSEIDLYLNNCDKLIKLEQSDWQDASRQLKQFKVFGILGEGSVSTLSACILYENQFGVRLLDGKWNRNTNGVVSSDLYFPDSGDSDESGMSVSGSTPGYANSHIGVSLSCTGKVK